ncbi:MAG: hypothetical protein H6740_07100 [Alphaproteobacteria bacterium]|nr:hypothetical protein [Alphaproteobacteria bacterium]
MPRALSLVILSPLALAVAGCGSKNVEPAPPPVGWHAEEGWAAQCYFPPDFAALEDSEGLAARRVARMDVLTAMKSQWSGQRDDGVSLPPAAIEDLDTVLLGQPDDIEAVAQQNLSECKRFMASGGGDTSGWEAWMRSMPDKLTAGQCLTPLRDTYFDYLDIGASWQFNVPICPGDTAVIIATTSDKYRLEESGEWITASGFEGMQADGDDYPCTREGCWVGMLVGRFVSEDGYEEVFPIGAEGTYTATAQGTLTITVNDSTYYDNTWFKSGGITDHTGVTVQPPQ